MPAITELSYLDASGKEQLRVSRLAMDVTGQPDGLRAGPPLHRRRSRARIYYGPVYFRKESEPYMTIAMPSERRAGATVAEVNLKFIWDVVNQIKIGRAGKAFVVDGQGTLIAPSRHRPRPPEDRPGVARSGSRGAERAAYARASGPRSPSPATCKDARCSPPARRSFPCAGRCSSSSRVEEAFEPLRSSITRTVLLVLLGWPSPWAPA